MMEAASTSETSLKFYQTTRRNNTEDSHFQQTNTNAQKRRIYKRENENSSRSGELHANVG
jgi:hypothetical protein